MVRASHWVRKKVSSVSITGNVSGLSLTLANGDVNGDNQVDNADQTLLTAAFMSNASSPNWNPDADLNGSGQESASDQAILSGSYGQIGDN